MGETLYRRPEIPFRWGETLFRTQSLRGEFHISQGETLFRGRLYFVTPAQRAKIVRIIYACVGTYVRVLFRIVVYIYICMTTNTGHALILMYLYVIIHSFIA